MTPSQFRTIALGMPGASESSHMGHPDFRVGGKVFASLSWTEEDEDCGMVRLTPEEQAEALKKWPGVFRPSAGAWGDRGYTHMCLAKARTQMLRELIGAAWRGAAPKGLAAEHPPRAARARRKRG